MRLLVYGGRGFRNEAGLHAFIDSYHANRPVTYLIEGGQVSTDPAERRLPWDQREKWGADYFGVTWRLSRGIAGESVNARWGEFGSSAGPRRNEVMAGMGLDYAIQCPGGRGTSDMRRRLVAKGVTILEYMP